ncbi:MAG: DUF1638 domain-containing protein [Chloroflexi bacterium]|nr:MAG: DUF1638 domain-containing protein [Chloroflexota bacterium]
MVQKSVNSISSPGYKIPPGDVRCMVIACATVIEEMLPFLPDDVPHEILDFGLHLHPDELRESLQRKIEEASSRADVLVLGYGLCSTAVVGLKAMNAALVIPRTDDCIGIFLGSCAAYRAQMKQEPGTYYLTKGWIEVGDSPFQDHHRLVKKYGEARADRMTRLMLKNYKRIGFINTGKYEIEQYREYARKAAGQFGLRFEEIQGSSALIRKMVFGPWDEDFVVVPPGQTVRFEDFALSVSEQA